jgi:hypothetical protein
MESMAKLIIKGMISDLPEEDQEKCRELSDRILEMVKAEENPNVGILGLTIAGLEIENL